jgi:DNA-binding transcriptional regulator YhcF (GntR family)
MFVAEGARARLVSERRERFRDQYLVPLLAEARKLGIDDAQLVRLITDISPEKES